jgi:hypothetical protein
LGFQLGASVGDRRQAQQPVEAAIGLGAISSECGVLQRRSPPADGDGPAQQAAQRGCEAGFATVDGILDIAQHMGEADLMAFGMALLGGPAVRDPAAWPMLGEQFCNHVAAARRVDTVQQCRPR